MTTPWNTSTASAGSALQTLSLQAGTGINGFPLQNGTPTILTWNVPIDGRLHRCTIFATEHVISAMTGGAVNVNFTMPDGIATSYQLVGATAATGFNLGIFPYSVTVAPGTAVTVTQGSALTAGSATLWAEIWGS